jgi:hypothetical protein
MIARTVELRVARADALGRALQIGELTLDDLGLGLAGVLDAVVGASLVLDQPHAAQVVVFLDTSGTRGAGRALPRTSCSRDRTTPVRRARRTSRRERTPRGRRIRTIGACQRPSEQHTTSVCGRSGDQTARDRYGSLLVFRMAKIPTI